MADFSVRGFNHTGFVVTDLDRAVGSFHDLLGFEVLSRAPRDPALMERMTRLPRPRLEVVHLQGPGHRIELLHYATNGIRNADQPRVYDDGAAHVAVDVDDVDAAVAAAAAYGLELVGAVITIDAGPNRGRKVCYLQSAYGLSIEFIGPPTAI